MTEQATDGRPTGRGAGRAARIEASLAAAFSPAALSVTDDSARHAGHAGARPGGETHYSVLMVSEAFRGQSRVARSRAVHEALAAEFEGGLHALALRLLTPEEADAAVRSAPGAKPGA
ncbi:MAG: BolA family transcriptional regulator [Proteobacteria bacterium]|nr:BolA family transcriptional regulator [Pseudomonadota bacterium]